MTSEECRLLIPEYLSGQLAPAEKELFEAQLGTSSELRMEVEELRAVWEGLAHVPEEQPSAELRARFYRRLSDVNHGRRQSFRGEFAWWKPGLSGLVRQAAIAIILFGLGMYAGRSNREANREGHTQGQEIAEMHAQVQSLRTVVALSLLDRQSATSRLEGVSWSSQVDRPDGELLAALLKTLNHDPNVNVRLSSLDALEKFSSNREVRKALVDSIPLQDSPLVQIALIDALVHARDNGAVMELKKLTSNGDVNVAVRQRARWGVERLSAN
jgi:hypothetical protein